MNIKRIILVSGLSGAGKSSVMSILEDGGYLCIDNFPLGLLETLIQWINDNDDERYSYLALSVMALDFNAAYKKIKKIAVNSEAVFLDAADDILVDRYQYSRMRHPFIVSGDARNLFQAISKEREQIAGLSDEVFRIDTTELKIKDLKAIIEQQFCRDDNLHFSISFISFGFRYGLPRDADIVYDVRFINNPYWVEKLKKLTGNDQAVIDYVFDDPRSQRLVEEMTGYLDFCFTEFIKEHKNHVTVAIGCTGGKHRSVAFANCLEEYYREKYHVLKLHRDVER